VWMRVAVPSVVDRTCTKVAQLVGQCTARRRRLTCRCLIESKTMLVIGPVGFGSGRLVELDEDDSGATSVISPDRTTCRSTDFATNHGSVSLTCRDCRSCITLLNQQSAGAGARH